MPKQQPDLGSLLVTKGAASASSKTIPQREALEDEPLQPMNFKVPPKFHREFKSYAASHGLRMNQLLFKAFELLKQSQP